MLYNRYRGFLRAYQIATSICLSVVFWAYLLILEMVGQVDSYNFDRYLLYNVVAILGLVLADMRARLVPLQTLVGFENVHHLAFRQTLHAGIAIILFLVVTKDAVISRIFLFSFLMLLFLALTFCHSRMPKILAGLLFPGKTWLRTLLIGPQKEADGLSEWISATGLFGRKVEPSASGNSLISFIHRSSFPSRQSLDELIQREGINQVILLELPSSTVAMDQLIEVVNLHGVRLLAINNFREIFRKEISLFSISGKDFVGLRDEPLEDPLNQMVKRAVDIATSALVVGLLLLPLGFFVLIAQAIQSPGPLLFQQTRSGLGRRPFRILKFRTMHPKKRSDARQASEGDERVFPFGKFLRRTSLDEMPQFVNVLFGQMALVGPRPHMVAHNRKFREIMKTYHIRSLVKPGITGLAQIKGFRGEAKNNEDVVERIKFDILYLENWSISWDFWILTQTARQVIRPPKCAY